MPISPNINNGKNKNPFKFSLWWMYAIVFFVLGGILYFDNDTVNKEVLYSDFERYVEVDHGIRKIVVYPDKREVQGFLTDSLASVLFRGTNYASDRGVDATVTANIPSADQLTEKIDKWRESGAFTGDYKVENSGNFTHLIYGILPLVLMVVFWIYLMRRMSGGGSAGPGGGVFSVGKSKAMLFDKNNSDKVTFKDVAGLSEA